MTGAEGADIGSAEGDRASQSIDALTPGTLLDERPRPWVLPLRIAISSGLLLFLFWSVRDDFSWSSLVPEWSPTTLAWLGGSVVLLLVGFFLSTLRWQQVLVALDLHERLRRLFSHFLAGQFLSAFLPGTVGGDVLRMSRLTRDVGTGPGSFASVVLERLTGWIVLPTITFLGFLLNPGLRHLGAETRIALAIAAATLVGLALVLYAVDHPKLGGRFAESEGWRRFAGAVHLGFSRLRHHPRVAATVLAVGFVYGMSVVLAALMAAKALGIDDLGITAMMAFLPVVLMAQVLPISIGGLGVREFALVFFLGAIGVSEDQALALGLLLYVLTLLTSLAGAPAFAVGGGRSPSPTAEAVA
jgi:uncharacterized membrane protein YbhN (UPF0104 family)